MLRGTDDNIQPRGPPVHLHFVRYNADMALREKKLANQNQAFEIANDMAKKQLKIVQSIASLLGETTADTLIALEHLKETIADD